MYEKKDRPLIIWQETHSAILVYFKSKKQLNSEYLKSCPILFVALG